MGVRQEEVEDSGILYSSVSALKVLLFNKWTEISIQSLVLYINPQSFSLLSNLVEKE